MKNKLNQIAVCSIVAAPSALTIWSSIPHRRHARTNCIPHMIRTAVSCSMNTEKLLGGTTCRFTYPDGDPTRNSLSPGYCPALSSIRSVLRILFSRGNVQTMLKVRSLVTGCSSLRRGRLQTRNVQHAFLFLVGLCHMGPWWNPTGRRSIAVHFPLNMRSYPKPTFYKVFSLPCKCQLDHFTPHRDTKRSCNRDRAHASHRGQYDSSWTPVTIVGTNTG